MNLRQKGSPKLPIDSSIKVEGRLTLRFLRADLWKNQDFSDTRRAKVF